MKRESGLNLTKQQPSTSSGTCSPSF